MTIRFANRIMPLSLAAGAFVLSAPAAAQAQKLRVTDILTTQTMTLEREGPLSGEYAKAAVAELQSRVDQDDPLKFREAAGRIVSRIPISDPAYPDALWMKAIGHERNGETDGALKALAELEGFAQSGERSLEIRRLAGEVNLEAGNWDEAAKSFEAVMDSAPKAGEFLGPSGLLNAAEAFVRAGKPREARAVLRKIDGAAQPAFETRRAYWLLESLLLEDDPSVGVPAAAAESEPLHAPIQLRRALLMELRGDQYNAELLYNDLQWQKGKLEGEEQKVLEGRIGG